MPTPIAVVLKGYPRLSETFIAQEIHALEQRGIQIRLFSLRHPYDPATHPIHNEIQAAVTYLPEYSADDIPRVLRAWWGVRDQPGYRQAFSTFIRDLHRDRTPNRIRRFVQAIVLAYEMPDDVGHYYAHFLHTPASVTRYASLINDKPWSISAHAKDIWTIPEWEKREKILDTLWLVTCTAANVEHLRGFTDTPTKISLLYHGLDFSRFSKNTGPPSKRDGGDASDPIRLVSVGRAVDKKGYRYLLEALAKLPPTVHWKFAHIGRGELLPTLKQLARRLEIEKHVEWLGALPQKQVLTRYRESDLFVLPSQVSNDGDRDGLPNVLMEAQSQSLACLSTDISGIPELITHGESGWLVAEKDSTALCDALELLITDVDLRNRLATTGFTRVREKFSLQRGIDQLVEKFTNNR